MKGYDDIVANWQIALDLPFYEGVGGITHDVAKPHQIATLTGPPTWTDVLASGTGLSDLGILQFTRASSHYLQIAGADSTDLDFTGDFTLLEWVYAISMNAGSNMLMCREEVSASGWGMYITLNAGAGNYLSLRTNHTTGTGRTDAYISNIPVATWLLLGYTRNQAGLSAIGYKNGVAQTTTMAPAGMIDPITSAHKLLVGVEDGEASVFFDGYKWRPRAWPRELSAAEMLYFFESERHWFGV